MLQRLYSYFVDLEREARAQEYTKPDSTTKSNTSEHDDSSPSELPLSVEVEKASLASTEAQGRRTLPSEYEGRMSSEQVIENAWCIRYLKYTTVSTFVEGKFFKSTQFSGE